MIVVKTYNNNFRGKRAECGICDDAACFTPDEKETLRKMLSNQSYDTGLCILDDKFWTRGDDTIEFVVPTLQSDKYYSPSLQDIIDDIIEGFDKAND